MLHTSTVAILVEAVLKYIPQLRGEELGSTFLQEESHRMFGHFFIIITHDTIKWKSLEKGH